MSNNHENTRVGLVHRAVAVAFALVVTGVIAAGLASLTGHLPIRHASISIETLFN